MAQLNKKFISKLFTANGENEQILAIPKSLLEIVQKGILPKSFGHWPKCCKSEFRLDIKNERKVFDKSRDRSFSKYISNSLIPDYIPCTQCSKAIDHKDRSKRKSVHNILSGITDNDYYTAFYKDNFPASMSECDYYMLKRIAFTIGTLDICYFVLRDYADGKDLLQKKAFFLKDEINKLKHFCIFMKMDFVTNPRSLIDTKLKKEEITTRLRKSGAVFGYLGGAAGNNAISKNCGGKIEECKIAGGSHAGKTHNKLKLSINEKVSVLGALEGIDPTNKNNAIIKIFGPMTASTTGINKHMANKVVERVAEWGDIKKVLIKARMNKLGNYFKLHSGRPPALGPIEKVLESELDEEYKENGYISEQSIEYETIELINCNDDYQLKLNQKPSGAVYEVYNSLGQKILVLNHNYFFRLRKRLHYCYALSSSTSMLLSRDVFIDILEGNVIVIALVKAFKRMFPQITLLCTDDMLVEKNGRHNRCLKKKGDSLQYTKSEVNSKREPIAVTITTANRVPWLRHVMVTFKSNSTKNPSFVPKAVTKLLKEKLLSDEKGWNKYLLSASSDSWNKTYTENKRIFIYENHENKDNAIEICDNGGSFINSGNTDFLIDHRSTLRLSLGSRSTKLLCILDLLAHAMIKQKYKDAVCLFRKTKLGKELTSTGKLKSVTAKQALLMIKKSIDEWEQHPANENIWNECLFGLNDNDDDAENKGCKRLFEAIKKRMKYSFNKDISAKEAVDAKLKTGPPPKLPLHSTPMQNANELMNNAMNENKEDLTQLLHEFSTIKHHYLNKAHKFSLEFEKNLTQKFGSDFKQMAHHVNRSLIYYYGNCYKNEAKLKGNFIYESSNHFIPARIERSAYSTIYERQNKNKHKKIVSIEKYFKPKTKHNEIPTTSILECNLESDLELYRIEIMTQETSQKQIEFVLFTLFSCEDKEWHLRRFLIKVLKEIYVINKHGAYGKEYDKIIDIIIEKQLTDKRSVIITSFYDLLLVLSKYMEETSYTKLLNNILPKTLQHLTSNNNYVSTICDNYLKQSLLHHASHSMDIIANLFENNTNIKIKKGIINMIRACINSDFIIQTGLALINYLQKIKLQMDVKILKNIIVSYIYYQPQWYDRYIQLMEYSLPQSLKPKSKSKSKSTKSTKSTKPKSKSKSTKPKSKSMKEAPNIYAEARETEVAQQRREWKHWHRKENVISSRNSINYVNTFKEMKKVITKDFDLKLDNVFCVKMHDYGDISDVLWAHFDSRIQTQSTYRWFGKLPWTTNGPSLCHGINSVNLWTQAHSLYTCLRNAFHSELVVTGYVRLNYVSGFVPLQLVKLMAKYYGPELTQDVASMNCLYALCSLIRFGIKKSISSMDDSYILSTKIYQCFIKCLCLYYNEFNATGSQGLSLSLSLFQNAMKQFTPCPVESNKRIFTICSSCSNYKIAQTTSFISHVSTIPTNSVDFMTNPTHLAVDTCMVCHEKGYKMQFQRINSPNYWILYFDLTLGRQFNKAILNNFVVTQQNGDIKHYQTLCASMFEIGDSGANHYCGLTKTPNHHTLKYESFGDVGIYCQGEFGENVSAIVCKCIQITQHHSLSPSDKWSSEEILFADPKQIDSLYDSKINSFGKIDERKTNELKRKELLKGPLNEWYKYLKIHGKKKKVRSASNMGGQNAAKKQKTDIRSFFITK